MGKANKKLKLVPELSPKCHPVKLFLPPLQVLGSKSTTANHFSSFFHAYA